MKVGKRKAQPMVIRVYSQQLVLARHDRRGDKRRRKPSGQPDNFEGVGLAEDEGDESERGGDAGRSRPPRRITTVICRKRARMTPD